MLRYAWHRIAELGGERAGRGIAEALRTGDERAVIRACLLAEANTLDPPRPTSRPAPDLVNRDFTAPAPDRLWVADATRLSTGEGVFWLAAVRDAFSNRIVGLENQRPLRHQPRARRAGLRNLVAGRP